jgi:hypothetical protein
VTGDGVESTFASDRHAFACQRGNFPFATKVRPNLVCMFLGEAMTARSNFWALTRYATEGYVSRQRRRMGKNLMSGAICTFQLCELSLSRIATVLASKLPPADHHLHCCRTLLCGQTLETLFFSCSQDSMGAKMVAKRNTLLSDFCHVFRPTSWLSSLFGQPPPYSNFISFDLPLSLIRLGPFTLV